MDPKVRVSTLIRSHDDPEKVKDSVNSIFPDWEPSNYPERFSFPVTRSSEVISAEIQSIDGLLSILRENRILDTALDAMAMKAHKGGTVFYLSRQSASIGKVSFVLEGKCTWRIDRSQIGWKGHRDMAGATDLAYWKRKSP